MRPLWVNVEETHYPALAAANLEVDVAIVGAGLSGLGVAFALQYSGARAAVLEARSVGSGASGRNGGFVLAGPAMEYCEAEDRLGADAARDVWQFTVDNNRELAKLVDTLELPCGYLRRGSMSLAASEAEMRILQRTHEALSASGVESCLVAAENLPRPFHRSYFGGLYYSGNAEMNSGAFVRGLAGALSQSVDFYENTRVTAMRRVGDGYLLITKEGTVLAGSVVLTTNAWTAQLLPGIPIEPVRGQVLATSALPAVVVPFPMYANHGYQYWRQTNDGRVVVGGWRDLDLGGEVGYDEVLHDEIQSRLERFATATLGCEPVVEFRWCGTMGFTPDHFPLVGQVPGSPGVYLAAGYSGHGVSMAFRCGQQVAMLALGREVTLPASFNVQRYTGVTAGN